MIKVCILLVFFMFSNTGVCFLTSHSASFLDEADAKINHKLLRYRVDKITVYGAKRFMPQQVISYAKIKLGSVVTQENLDKALHRIKQAYLEAGFLQVKISSDKELQNPSPETDEVLIKLVINLYEGESFFLRRIECEGNKTTEDTIVANAIKLSIGKPFNPMEVDDALRRLNKLGRFEKVKKENVQIEINEQEHFVDLVFHLKEKRN